MLARPSAGIGVVEVQKPMVFFCDFCGARATLGVVEVQKPMVFCDFCGARATLCGDRRGRGAKTRGFFAIFVVRTGPRELSRGSRACSRNRRVAGSIPPWSAGGRRKMQLAF